jgi:hypothetical protein
MPQSLSISAKMPLVPGPLYKAVMLPVVMYGSETWSLTLREEHGLRVSQNRVLRGVLESRRDEVTGGWRKLHNEWRCVVCIGHQV